MINTNNEATGISPYRVLLSLIAVVSLGLMLGVVVQKYRQNYDDGVQYGDYSRYFAGLDDQQLIMLSVDWCPVCQQAREYLAKQNIRYLDLDIEKNNRGKALSQEFEQDYVPLLIFRDRIINGYSPGEVNSALGIQDSNQLRS